MMSALSKVMSRHTAIKIIIYCATALWMTQMIQILFEPLPWHLFIVPFVMGGILFAAIWRISED
jgi:hypothetical protein